MQIEHHVYEINKSFKIIKKIIKEETKQNLKFNSLRTDSSNIHNTHTHTIEYASLLQKSFI